eukprot:Gb_24234 [translate_table: standard]
MRLRWAVREAPTWVHRVVGEDARPGGPSGRRKGAHQRSQRGEQPGHEEKGEGRIRRGRRRARVMEKREMRLGLQVVGPHRGMTKRRYDGMQGGHRAEQRRGTQMKQGLNP